MSLRKDTLSHAYELLKVEDPKKRRRLAEQVANGELSLVKLREKIEGRPHPAATGQPDEAAPDDSTGSEDEMLSMAPRARSGGAPADDALVAAKQSLAEALEQWTDLLASAATMREIGETDRANLAKYLTIAKIRLENAITVVRTGHPTD